MVPRELKAWAKVRRLWAEAGDLTEQQIALIEQMVAQRVNAIVVAPSDSKALVPACKGNLVRVHEELGRQGATLSYQSLTAYCRRQVMLRYFGEHLAEPFFVQGGKSSSS